MPRTQSLLLLLLALSCLLSAAALWRTSALRTELAALSERLVQLEQSSLQYQTQLSLVGQEMEKALAQQASLVTGFRYNIQAAPQNKLFLTLNAQLKSYEEGMAASFQVTPKGGETQLVKTNLKGNTLSANVTLPLCQEIQVGLVLTGQSRTQAQVIDTLTEVEDCLTGHLYLTPGLSFTQQRGELLLEGNYSVLNTLDNLEERKLTMVRLEITQGEQLLHTLYFSQDFSGELGEDMGAFVLNFNRLRTPLSGQEPVLFAVRVRDQGGLEYLCQIQSLELQGEEPQLLQGEGDFQLVH